MSGPLTHSPASILRQLLVDLSLGSSPPSTGVAVDSWPAYYSQEPDVPDEVITVYDTEGLLHGRDMTSGRRQEHHGSQIRLRAKNESDGWTKARAILISLEEDVAYNGVTVGNDSYIVYSISRQSGPISLGKEPNSNRRLFTINVVMAIRQTT